MVEVSRRAIFRHIVSGAGFELDHETANDVLMRINRSLDPIPVTEGMWASLVAARRERRYRGGESQHEASFAEAEAGLLEPVGRLRSLPEHIARDLTFLLRVEHVLRAWRPPGKGEAPPLQVRDDILVRLAKEVRQYLGGGGTTEADEREVLVPVVRCLARAAKIEVPSETGEFRAILASGSPPEA